MSIINFYKKQTVLNDILINPNIIIVDNSQLNSLINSTKNNKDTYQISMENVEIDTNYNDSSLYLNKLYSRQYNIIPKTTNEEIINNIKRYNNVEYSINISESHYRYNFSTTNKQNIEYNNYNKISNSHSIILDSTYNYLYYLQYNKLNLMSYTLELSNGFNYDDHMLHFNIDNNYIRSINNTLYYNYNKIRSITNSQYGISLLDDNYFKTKNISHNAFINKLNGILTINKNFKYDIFSALEQLKNLYNNCTNIYNTLSYYDMINYYNNDYLQFYSYLWDEFDQYVEHDIKRLGNSIPGRPRVTIKVGTEHANYYYRHSYETDIDFEDTKLYLTDLNLNINELDILNANTIYISDLNNINLRIGDSQNNIINYNNINESNCNILKNRTILQSNYDNNVNIKISYNYNYKYITNFVQTSFIETSNNVFEQNQHTNIKTITNKNVNRFVVGTSYYLNMQSDIDKNIFNNSGINIKYIGSPYLTYYDVDKDIDKNTCGTINKQFTVIETTGNDGNTFSQWIHKYTTTYYTYTHHQKITIPTENTLNICKIQNTIQKTFKSNPSFIYTSLNNVNENMIGYNVNGNEVIDKYYILSNKNLFHFDNIEQIKRSKSNAFSIGFCSPSIEYFYPTLYWNNSEGQIRLYRFAIELNDYLVKLLKGKNLIFNTNNLHYYKIYSANGYSEYYPVLNIYPNKYLNEKFFDTLLYSKDKYVVEEELDTCIFDIKNINYDNNSYDSKILYLYEINCTDNLLYFYSMVKLPEDYNYDRDREDFALNILKNTDSINAQTDVSSLNNIKSLYEDRIVNKSNLTKLGTYGYDNLYRYMSLYVNHFINFN